MPVPPRPRLTLLNRRVATVAALLALTLSLNAPATCALTLALPSEGDLIGSPAEVTAQGDDTLIDIAHRHGLGYEELVNANPGVDPWLPGAGTVVRLPLRRILPDVPREGIVVNLPEHRLYYFPPARAGEPRLVITYPVSVGKMDWHTPIGLTRVVAKVKDPPWYPPESVRSEHAARGDPLPKVVPPGPDNPLGQFALRLGIPGGAYLIHGTNRPAGVGMQVTHGCMRLYPEDIEALFKLVPVDTPVRIVNQPHKAGWTDGRLYVEVHPPLEEGDPTATPDRSALARLVTREVRSRPLPVDWALAEGAYSAHAGIPVAVTAEPLAGSPGATPAAGLGAFAQRPK
jgi:L,D-transpeptidase ErfK/SrfK